MDETTKNNKKQRAQLFRRLASPANALLDNVAVAVPPSLPVPVHDESRMQLSFPTRASSQPLSHSPEALEVHDLYHNHERHGSRTVSDGSVPGKPSAKPRAPLDLKLYLDSQENKIKLHFYKVRQYWEDTHAQEQPEWLLRLLQETLQVQAQAKDIATASPTATIINAASPPPQHSIPPQTPSLLPDTDDLPSDFTLPVGISPTKLFHCLPNRLPQPSAKSLAQKFYDGYHYLSSIDTTLFELVFDSMNQPNYFSQLANQFTSFRLNPDIPWENHLLYSNDTFSNVSHLFTRYAFQIGSPTLAELSYEELHDQTRYRKVAHGGIVYHMETADIEMNYSSRFLLGDLRCALSIFADPLVCSRKYTTNFTEKLNARIISFTNTLLQVLEVQYDMTYPFISCKVLHTCELSPQIPQSVMDIQWLKALDLAMETDMAWRL
ncbi:hypothetical protein DL98DRAFT_589920 [Cadophora sp. DSE1049]|nr:hypothetical protein DL98DRAFT_589920 [Cadophora sp. DSE1049]